MYRATKLSGVWYAAQFEEVEDEVENIEEFVNSGDIVIIAENLSDIELLLDEDVILAGDEE